MILFRLNHFNRKLFLLTFAFIVTSLASGCASESGGDDAGDSVEDVSTDSLLFSADTVSDTIADDTSATQTEDSASAVANDTGDSIDTAEDTVLDTSADTGADTDSAVATDTASETDPSRIALINETLAMRGVLSVPTWDARLTQGELTAQLPNYDPGSLLRCNLNENENYNAIVDALGGVQWGYHVSILEDNSKPIFQAGLPEMLRDWLNAAGDADGGAPVEIAEADIVGLSDEAAVFASNQHGLMLVDLTGDLPQFVCAAKLPGISSKFYYYDGKLVVMAQSIVPGGPTHSYLLHFAVASNALPFVEAIDLGLSRVLDSRRFNGRLVIYTDMIIEEMQTISQGGVDTVVPMYANADHRMLRVFNWGNTLTEELSETQVSEIEDLSWVQVSPDTHSPGEMVHQASYFGNTIWASDRYFVITESIRQTYLAGFETRSYTRCTESHTVEIPYTYCYTNYEERPNPNYREPDAPSSGDRSCSSETLADCLRRVASESNKTIQVPIGRTCEEKTRHKYICDAYETVEYTVPQYTHERYTRLAIYEYTADGFIKFASQVAEIENENLSGVALTDSVDTLTTSAEAFDLQISGGVQTLYFQNGFLYVIAEGVLQVYAMGENSLVRTSTLPVVNDTLQTSLFTDDTIYLSDFSWNGRADDTSQLKLVNLANPGFPTLAAETEELPGGHTHILAISQGIFTIGRVSQFDGQNISALKLGLFGNPDTSELSYLILGTDLDSTNISGEKDFYFNRSTSQLFLPYYGLNTDTGVYTYRVGMSHVSGNNIVTDGELETPELLLRVRPEPGADRMMGFSNNLIESFGPGVDGWEMQTLLEYYTPIALYRYTAADDYVEVLRLGNRCRLHLAKADQINVRDEANISDPFICSGSVWAYEQNLVFTSTIGMAFASDGTLTPLTTDEITILQEARAARPYCLLSTTERLPAGDLKIDFASSAYSMDDFTCMSPEEYWELANDYSETTD